MKQQLLSLLFFLLWGPGLCMLAKAQTSATPNISTYQTVRPVLIGKPDNVVLSIRIEIDEEASAVDLQEILLSTTGTDDLEDIRSIGLYYTGDSSRFFAAQAFDILKQPESLMSFQGALRLSPGINYLWAVCELSPSANPDHRIQLAFHSALLSDGKTLRVPATETSKSLRIGHAIRQRGQDGVHTYRIPGLASTNQGTLIGVYDLRRNSSTDLQEDIDVGMSRSTDGGRTWEPMKIIMDMGEWGGKSHGENGIGDPSVLVDRQTNTIWVAGIWAHGHPGKRNWFASRQGMKPEETSQFVLVKSEDDGLTWSEPINITSQIKHPDWHLLLQGPGKGISLRDGTLVFPAQFKDEQAVPHSTLIYSKDHGKSWKIGTGAKSHTTESQLVELGDGSIMLNMRDDRGRNNPEGGARSIAITPDLGKTWTEHPTSMKTLPEPVCMASLIRIEYKGEALLFFSNPAVPKGPRRRITLKASTDEGMSWPTEYHLLLNEDTCYGYSCLTRIDEETLGILYEGPGELYFQRIRIAEVVGNFE